MWNHWHNYELPRSGPTGWGLGSKSMIHPFPGPGCPRLALPTSQKPSTLPPQARAVWTQCFPTHPGQYRDRIQPPEAGTTAHLLNWVAQICLMACLQHSSFGTTDTHQIVVWWGVDNSILEIPCDVHRTTFIRFPCRERQLVHHLKSVVCNYSEYIFCHRVARSSHLKMEI